MSNSLECKSRLIVVGRKVGAGVPVEMALAAYRHLLRSTRIAFEGTGFLVVQDLSNKLTMPSGDNQLLHAARVQAREGFNSLRLAKATSDEATKGIAHAKEVAKLLRHNIVQGRKVEGKDALRELRLAVAKDLY